MQYSLFIYVFCNLSSIISGNNGLDRKTWTATYLSIYSGYLWLFFYHRILMVCCRLLWRLVPQKIVWFGSNRLQRILKYQQVLLFLATSYNVHLNKRYMGNTITIHNSAFHFAELQTSCHRFEVHVFVSQQDRKWMFLQKQCGGMGILSQTRTQTFSIVMLIFMVSPSNHNTLAQ